MFGLFKSHKPSLAVVDCETTGLRPECSDRIVEIAIVRLASDGSIIDEYTTLLNPKRDVGPSSIHGIRASDITSAPEWLDVAGCISHRLDGATIIGHNVTFDLRFIRNEFKRIKTPLPPINYCCTMRLARIIDPDVPGRSLDHCCSHFGIKNSDQHHALADAKATAALFQVYLERLAASPGDSNHVRINKPAEALPDRWPKLHCSGRSLTRDASRTIQKSERTTLARLIENLPPAICTYVDREEYFALLDRILADRLVTHEEADTIVDYARMNNLSTPELKKLNEVYLSNLVEVAYDDGVLSEIEESDLRNVKELLGISDYYYSNLCAQFKEQTKTRVEKPASETSFSSSLAGKSVCFTGEMICRHKGIPITRELAESLAAERGLVVKSGVSKKLNILVVSDPNSQSTKARKAREYGTQILAEAVFWQMLGVAN